MRPSSKGSWEFGERSSNSFSSYTYNKHQASSLFISLRDNGERTMWPDLEANNVPKVDVEDITHYICTASDGERARRGRSLDRERGLDSWLTRVEASVCHGTIEGERGFVALNDAGIKSEWRNFYSWVQAIYEHSKWYRFFDHYRKFLQRLRYPKSFELNLKYCKLKSFRSTLQSLGFSSHDDTPFASQYISWPCFLFSAHPPSRARARVFLLTRPLLGRALQPEILSHCCTLTRGEKGQQARRKRRKGGRHVCTRDR